MDFTETRKENSVKEEKYRGQYFYKNFSSWHSTTAKNYARFLLAFFCITLVCSIYLWGNYWNMSSYYNEWCTYEGRPSVKVKLIEKTNIDDYHYLYCQDVKTGKLYCGREKNSLVYNTINPGCELISTFAKIEEYDVSDWPEVVRKKDPSHNGLGRVGQLLFPIIGFFLSLITNCAWKIKSSSVDEEVALKFYTISEASIASIDRSLVYSVLCASMIGYLLIFIFNFIFIHLGWISL